MNKKLLTSLAAIIILVLAVLGFQQFSDSDDKDTTDNVGTSQEASTETDVTLEISEDPSTSTSAPAPGTSPEDRADTVLTPLLGAQTGTASLLLSSLNFPEATMTTNADDSFSLEASGLSLSLLGNQDLQVNGEYPLVAVTASGAGDITGDESVDLIVSRLKVETWHQACDD